MDIELNRILRFNTLKRNLVNTKVFTKSISADYKQVMVQINVTS